MKWLYKNSNPFGIFDYGWKTAPDQKEYLDLGYGLAFFVASYDGNWNTNTINEVLTFSLKLMDC